MPRKNIFSRSRSRTKFRISVYSLIVDVDVSPSDARIFRFVAARHYEIDRSRVILSDILGVGQFGDVFRGVYQETVTPGVDLLSSSKYYCELNYLNV